MTARGSFVAALLAGVTLTASNASAIGPELSLGVLGGWSKPAASMADYQFEITPRPALGARVRAGLGPADLGVRVWSAPNTQSLGLAGVEDPSTRTTTWDLTSRMRVADVLGQRLSATASAGRLALTYDPARLSIPVGGGPDVVVALAPIHEWVAGAGFAIERGVGEQWSVDLEVEHRWFGLDTARSVAGSLVESRERFGTWDVRVGWNWIHGR